MSWRPTTLRLVEQHCPKALDFQEADTPYPREPFAVGIAAHAVLAAIVTETTWRGAQLSQEEVDATAREIVGLLCSEDRRFDGRQEPPLAPAAALAGRDLAVRHLQSWWPQPGARAELGIAVDRRWNLVAYDDEAAWLRCILDYASVEEVGDEETAVTGLVIRDYKSSWAADEGELETVQRRVQAALGFAAFADRNVAVVRIEVANLRTQAVFTRDFWLSDAGDALAALRADLEATIGAMERWAPGKRPAAPGACCCGCPYVLKCDWAAEWAEGFGLPGTAENRARAYAATYARLQELSQAVRADVGRDSIAVPGGVVGYVSRPRRRPTEGAFATAAAEWGVEDQRAVGLLRAANLGVGSLEGIAKVLYPERTQRAERDAWMASLVRVEQEKVFGVFREQGGEDDREPS